ncbi:FecR family protein [Parabacteroides bouchesdurhonensis]|uniref:FecR family protein n=1 Tax=Parabacteroides bouchesdurhonensis TaxID=1936995 RepID=UPI000E4FCA10|nr:FecR family protein [Parabacteroides bouchesdurhonensis]RHJ92106.1 FecR family protein [Bacteroides sp. AM07-16]
MERNYYIQLFDKFLQKQATSEEVRELILWLQNDSEFSAWADEEWNIVSSEMNPELQQQLFEKIKAKIEPQKKAVQIKKHKLYVWPMRIAATLLLMLATGLSIYFHTVQKMTMPDMIVAVEKGQKANVTLPDGSKVWVNSDSKLTYGSRFNSAERVLRLEGEAYFEVTPDKERPFIVETNNISVRALGTSFDVKNYADEDHISTVLMTGKVEVKSDKDCIILEPNEKVTFNKATGHMRKSSVENAVGYANWKFNILSFNAETFENIAHTLERYYNTQIAFESEPLKKYRFTGSIGNTSLESVLQILSLTSPLSYEVKDSLIILRENITQKKYYENALK